MTDKIGGFVCSATYHYAKQRETPQINDDLGLKIYVAYQQKRVPYYSEYILDDTLGLKISY